MKMIVFLTLILYITFFDLWTKFYFSQILSYNDIIIWKSIVFTLQYNKGIAFSLPIKGYLQLVLSIGILTIFIVYVLKYWGFRFWLTTIGSSFVIGGAIGNLYERIFKEKVTDFIQVFTWFPVFNIADSCICIGIILLLIFEWNIHKQLL